MIFPVNGTYLQNTNYTLNTSRMTVDTFYEIIFRGIKGQNEGLRYFELELIGAQPPQPIIRIADGTPFEPSLVPSQYGQLLRPNADIRIIGDCVQPCNISTYEWKLRPGNETDFNEVAWEEFSHQPTGITTDTLFIPRELIESRLPDIYRYEIELQLVDSENVRGVAAIKIAINLPPRDGTCDLISSSTISVGEGVNVTCDNWKDEHGIATYTVYTRNSQISTDSLISIRESGQLTNLKLPMGPESDEYKLEILIQITDNFESSTTKSVGEVIVSDFTNCFLQPATHCKGRRLVFDRQLTV
ncbi:uncharacterized protein LOC117104100 [Anneissia japonica]|uniref:uncharacterized protein LOC117104100 n=1 Tax=Anneissia japonica TaxID=1529436 RepID=UPI001425B560|nr:uncharacterized protein LOC117104100 [Anneissia japonica]